MKQLFTLICIFLLSQAAMANKKTLEHMGDAGLILMPIAVLGSTVWHRDETGFFQYAASFGLGTATTLALKYTVRRERPNEHDKESFPSAHAEISFVSATFMQRRYGWNYGIPAYLAASFVGYTRIATKWHWTTDVLAGAAIGIGSGLLFTRPYKNKVTVSPFFGDHTAGIAFRADL